MQAALLKALDDGLRRKIEPGPPGAHDFAEVAAAGEKLEPIPTTLRDALDALADDEVERSALPGRMRQVYDRYKRDEGERFIWQVSDRDAKDLPGLSVESAEERRGRKMFDVTEEQIAKFDEDGFLIVDSIIDDRTVELLRDAYVELFRGEFETGIWPDEVNWQEGTGDPSLTRQICNGWKANRAVASVVLRADFGRAIARMGGWPGTRVMIDNVLWKPPATRPLGYHRDSAYLEWYHPSDLLSLWIALDRTSADGGTLEFVRGSHKWSRSQPEGEFHGPHEYQKFMRLSARREGVEPEIVPVVVKKGGGSFHHGWTWHGSGYNNSDRPRRSLVLHAMRSDARYAPEHLGRGTGRIYGRYKRLADNEIDENYFPVLWREDGYRTPGIDRFLLLAA